MADPLMRHIVMFSGGIGSWAAAKRVVQRYGTENLTLLFTDTKIEDEDLYRFLSDASENVGGTLVKLAEGRDPWQIFNDRRFLGNSHVDPCSKILKRDMADKWLRDNCDPTHTVVYVGIDWTEEHRFTRLKDRRATAGWTYEAPLCNPPYLSKFDMLAALKSQGIPPPRLYAMGFTHNNCGGFCVKAGHGHFATLLREMPERYAYHEQKEQEIRAVLGDVSMLVDRSGDNVKKPLTLRVLRERIESKSGIQPDLFDIGGCGCFIDEPDAVDREEQ